MGIDLNICGMNGRVCEPEEYPLRSYEFDQLTEIPDQPRSRAELDEFVGKLSGDWGVCRDGKLGTFYLYRGFRKSNVPWQPLPAPPPTALSTTAVAVPIVRHNAKLAPPTLPGKSPQPLRPAAIDSAQPAASGMPFLINTGLADRVEEVEEEEGPAVLFAPKVYEVSAPRHLDKLLGKLGPKNRAIVTVSAPWCPACKGYKPRFESLAQAYGDRHPFIWISNGDDDMWSHLDVNSYPTVFQIDSEGNRVKVRNRNNPLRGIKL